MASKVSVVDVGVGNIRSICNGLQRLGAIVVLAASPTEVGAAERLVLPGVGHFGNAMARLKNLGFGDALDEAVLDRKVPVLGICLGLQLMAQGSDEGDAPGLGWLDARVVRLRVLDRSRWKVPHIGWNSASPTQPSALLAGVDTRAEYYFTHSYHLDCTDPRMAVATTEYGAAFPSVIEHGNIFGTQFHPEKSREAGQAVLRNFVAV